MNLLDPALELYNPAGALVASDNNSAADGRNAHLTYAALVTGSYHVRVFASANTIGEYFLKYQLNHAPVLDNSGSPTLSTILEDQTDNPGNLVSVILATGAGGNPISDADPGALQGIAIVAADISHGTWQYTMDGTNWLPLGTPSTTSARLLASDGNTSVRFLPSADFNGGVAAAITFQAWDQTSGANGGLGNASQNGGAASFSSAVETATLQITPVNDPPVRTNGTLTAITVNEDSADTTAVTLGLSGLAYAPGPATALDEASQTLTYTVSTIPSFVQLFKADGTTPVTAGGTVTAAELPGLTYKTLTDANGSGNVVLTIIDSGKLVDWLGQFDQRFGTLFA